MSTRYVRVGPLRMAAIIGQAEPKMLNLGNAIAGRMQRLVPKRTWALHDSIKVEQSRRGTKLKVVVSAGDESAPYALFVERGTSRAPAQPFMRPAFLQSNAGDLLGADFPTSHGLVDYTRRDGTVIQVTAAQRDNYSRNRTSS